MIHIRGSAYEKDERSQVSGLCEHVPKKVRPVSSTLTVPLTPEHDSDDNLTNAQRNMIYHIGCHILGQIKRNCTVCSTCLNSCLVKKPPSTSFAKYSTLCHKQFTESTFISIEMYRYFVALSNTVDINFDTIKNQNISLNKHLLSLLVNIPYTGENCHNLQGKILKRFVMYRIKCAHVKRTKKRRFNSGTMYNV